MKGSQIIVMLAIITLGALEAYALSQGINGVLFSGVAAMIAGLGGYQVKNLKDKNTDEKHGN